MATAHPLSAVISWINSPYNTASIVVPTYNRGKALCGTLEALLKSDTEQLATVEIIVVDDGSTQSVAHLVTSYSVAPPFSLTCIRQDNAGPAAARNAGFRQARGYIVIFMDDDIIGGPDLIRQHVLAHQRCPGSVIFGRSVLTEAASKAPLFSYLSSLSYGETIHPEIDGLANEDIIASGHISVQSDMFDKSKAVYRDDLCTPGAEEFELSFRLRELGVPILMARGIVALHDQPIDLEGFCRQQYKHAVGTAEVMMKYPGIRNMPALRVIIRTNFEPLRGITLQAVKRMSLKVLATRPIRSVGRLFVQFIERLIPSRRMLMPLYRIVVSAYYHAGLRDGSRRTWK